MNNDTIKLIRKTSNVNSLMVIIFYMLDIALIRLGDLAVYHIAGKSAYYEDIAQLVSYCIQYLVVVPIVLVVFRLVSGKKEGLNNSLFQKVFNACKMGSKVDCHIIRTYLCLKLYQHIYFLICAESFWNEP